LSTFKFAYPSRREKVWNRPTDEGIRLLLLWTERRARKTAKTRRWGRRNHNRFTVFTELRVGV
jgi:hypothetical protein